MKTFFAFENVEDKDVFLLVEIREELPEVIPEGKPKMERDRREKERHEGEQHHFQR